MLQDFLLNLLASAAWDLLKVLGKRPSEGDDLRREVSDALRRHTEAIHALQAVLARFGAPRVAEIGGDVSGSVIVLGDGNRISVGDGGLLAQRWQELQVSDAEAADLYRERIANLYAQLPFPLKGISFEAMLHEVYTPLQVAPVQGLDNWHLAERAAPHQRRETDELLKVGQPVALLGLLGGGKTTTLRYLTWAYARRPDDSLLWRGDELIPFYVTARHLAEAWQGNDGVHPSLRSGCDGRAGAPALLGLPGFPSSGASAATRGRAPARGCFR